MSAVDSFRSWVVAASSSLIFLLISWPMRLGAQLFVSMLDRYDTNRKDASFPFALASLMRSLSGPFAGFLGGIIGLEAVTLLGCLFCTIGVGGCFFAEGMVAIDISLGIIYGIGFGWSTCLVPEILNRNFKKHRNKAYGLYFGGGGIGAFVSPPILEVILYSFGVSGTFLIMCGVILHSVPAAMLLNVPKTAQKSSNIDHSSNDKSKPPKQSSTQVTSNAESNSLLKKEPTENIQLLDIELHIRSVKNPKKNNSSITINAGSDSFLSKEPTVNREPSDFEVHSSNKPNIQTDDCDLDTHKIKTKRREAEFENSAESQIVTTKYQSSADSECQNSKSDPNKNGLASISSIKSSLRSINILWHPLFFLISSLQGVNVYLNYLFWTITVDLMRDKGIEKHLEVYFVMCLSLFDTMGRFFLGTLIDCGLLTVASLCAACFAVTGLSCFLLTWLTGFYSNIAAVCLLGVVFGGNTACLPGTITEFIREEKRAIAMSSRLIMYIPMSFTMSPLIGHFRGTLGSYNGLLYVMTAISVICTILTALLPEISKKKCCRQASENDEWDPATFQ